MLRRTALFALMSTLALACTNDGRDHEPATEQRAADGPLVGHSVEFAVEPSALDHDRVQAITQHIESLVAAESMKVRVEKSDEGGMLVIAEAWGRAPTTDDAIVASLRSTFPELKDAVITAKPATGSAPDGELPTIEVDEDEDPDAIKAKVLEQLKAKGVDGDVRVHVDELDDGKREVRVEVEKKDEIQAP